MERVLKSQSGRRGSGCPAACGALTAGGLVSANTARLCEADAIQGIRSVRFAIAAFGLTHADGGSVTAVAVGGAVLGNGAGQRWVDRTLPAASQSCAEAEVARLAG